WLGAPDPSTNHNKACDRRQTGTGRWFLAHDQYGSWKTSPNSLLLRNFPGRSDTCLRSSTAVEDAKYTCATDPGFRSAWACFYFDFQDEAKRTLEGLLLSLLSQLLLRSQDVPHAIKSLYEKRIQGRPSVSALLACLEDTMRTFLLVRLRLEIFRKCTTPDEITAVLTTLPKDLYATYDRILDPIPDHKLGNVYTLLMWLTHSYRPMTLRELCECLMIDITSEEHPRLNPGNRPFKPELAFSEFSSLITISSPAGPDSTVQLCHASVKDYLVSGHNHKIALEPKDANRKMALFLWYSHDMLDAATSQNYTEITAFLLDRGANVNAGNVLSIAVAGGHLDIVTLLLDRGADVNTRNALAKAAEGHLDIVTLLLDRGADVNAEDVLAIAAVRGHLDIVTLLLDRGADVNAGNALESAAGGGRLDIVTLLLDRVADVNAGDALARAAVRGHLDIVTLLLDRVADVNAGYALARAAVRGHLDIVTLLLDRVADVNAEYALAIAAVREGGHLDIVTLLLDQGADVNAGNALATAALYGHLDIVTLLLNRGADVNAGNALANAAGGGRLDIVTLLLDRGADVNAEYALASAIMEGHLDIVTLLLDRGAEVNSCDKHANTALVEAAAFDRPEAVALLVGHGA
ncbi:ankyrin, partial [Punctularia strigosozonata HHB-11173 SS5]|uniref:ankyrin n=1 Tax=Punctularia strigosozonata (strain HHB-11173) TaxID=741275 RepID=UPI0004416A89